MTKEKLNNIKRLRKTIDSLKNRIANEEAKATSANSGQWKRVTERKKDGTEESFTLLRGMPRAPGVVSDKVGNGAAELADMRKELRTLERRRNRLIAYVNAIDDKYIREIMIWHFINEETWDITARKMGYTYSTGDCVRKACERFLACKKSKKTRFPRA